MSDEQEKTFGKGRLEALSDGVFAIAMTLLVLDIRMPETSKGASIPELLHALKTLGPAFFSFVMTFVLSGSFWFLHHVTFHNTKYVTRGLVAINILFLMFVSLLPFSTGMLGRLGPAHPFGVMLYFANQLALSLVLNLHWRYARNHGLLEEPAVYPRARFVIAVQPVCFVAAMATALVSPQASYWVIFIVMVVARRVANRRFKATPADAPAPL
jgi:uncharacterized membrane protein